MKKQILTSVAALGLLFGAANATIYSVDAVHSSTAFKIKHLQVSNVTGTFSKFSGALDITDKIPSNLTATIEVDSINTNITIIYYICTITIYNMILAII